MYITHRVFSIYLPVKPSELLYSYADANLWSTLCYTAAQGQLSERTDESTADNVQYAWLMGKRAFPVNMDTVMGQAPKKKLNASFTLPELKYPPWWHHDRHLRLYKAPPVCFFTGSAELPALSKQTLTCKIRQHRKHTFNFYTTQ